MTTLTDNPDTSAIRAKLHSVWSRECRFIHLRGLSRVLPWLVVMFLFELLLDWLVVLPSWARLLLLPTNIGVAGWLVYRHWLRHLHRFDATRVSLQIEKLHPRLNSLLVSYVQLSGTSDPAYGSRNMIDSMCGQAEKTVSPLDFRGVVEFKKLRWLLALTGCVLVGFLVSVFFAHEYYLILMGRLLSPFSNQTYPTRTRIELIDRPGAIKQGDTAILKAKASGVIPERGTISVRFENAGWEEFPLALGDDKATFTYQIANVVRGFSYKFRIGDAFSEEVAVEVVLPPRLIKANVSLKFPAYTGGKSMDLDRLQLPPMPDGTAITWTLTCDQELESAALVIDGNTQATATNPGNSGAYASGFVITNAGAGYIVPPIVTLTGATGAGATATAQISGGQVTGITLVTPGSGYTTYTLTINRPQIAMPVREDAHQAVAKIGDVGKLVAAEDRLSKAIVHYHSEWTVSRAGRKFTFVDPTRYTLEVVLDKPPLVILVRPRPTGLDRPHLALARVKLKLMVDVSDDYGISKVDVVFWVNPQPKETSQPLRWNIPLEKDSGKRQMKLSAVWPILDSYPALKEGDVLKCAIEAADNRATAAGPNVQTSESFYMRIVNEKEYNQYIGKEFTQGLDSVRYYADQELISAKTVKSLIAP